MLSNHLNILHDRFHDHQYHQQVQDDHAGDPDNLLCQVYIIFSESSCVF
jgi:hypothetical protein